MSKYFEKLKSVPFLWYVPLIIISLVLFVILYTNFTQVVNYFPISESHMDVNSHIVRTHFLKEYGFDIVPNWYNGFYAFRAYYFAYFAVTLPFYLLFGNVSLAVLITVSLIYLGSLIFSLYLFKSSKKKGAIFFVLFFLNPIILFDSLHLGRLPELLGWFVFLLQAILIFKYIDKSIDWKFIVYYSIISAALILSETMIFFVSISLLAGLFLIKNLKDKVKIIYSFAGSLLLTIWWWLPIFLRNDVSNIGSFYGVEYLKSQFIQNSSTILVFKNWYHDLAIIAFLFIAYLFIRTSENKVKSLLFLMPGAVMGLLYLFKIVYFLPIIKNVYHLIFIYFFWFMFLYLLFNIDFAKLRKFSKVGVLGFLYHIYIPSIAYLLLFGGIFSFEHNEIEKETIFIANQVDERFVVVPNSDYSTIHYPSLVSYITYYTNETSTMGWTPQNADLNVLAMNEKLIEDVQKNNCVEIMAFMQDQEVMQILSFGNYCESLLECGLNIKSKTDNVCLLYDLRVS